jgi:hypothetical protein
MHKDDQLDQWHHEYDRQHHPVAENLDKFFLDDKKDRIHIALS